MARTTSALVMGSPIKEHAVPSALGPVGAGAAATSGPMATSGPVVATGARTASALAAGSGSVSGTHFAGAGVAAKTAAIGGLFGSLVYTAAMVAVGYLGYRAAKALWEKAGKKQAASAA